MKSNNNSAKATAGKSTISRVLSLIKPYGLYIFLVLIAAAFTVFCQLYIPILTGKAIDGMVAAGQVDFKSVYKILILIACAAVLSSAGQWLLGIFNNRIAYGIGRDLRDRAAGKIQRLPLAYLDTHPAGDLVSRITVDIDTFSDGLLLGFTQFFTGILTIAGTLVFMFSVSPIIALVVMCVTPLSLIAAAFIAKKTYKHFSVLNSVRGDETALINERIDGLRVIQSLGRENENIAEFDTVNKKLGSASLKAVFYSSITNPSTRFINGIVYAGVGLVGSLSVISGGLSIGQLSCFLTYANQYTKPFNEISGVITEMQNALSCVVRVFEFLDTAEETKDSADAVILDFAGNSGKVDINHIDFSYTPERELIKDFDLHVDSGQKIAIVGPTGCGKTTLINLLMRFYDVQSGAVCIDGTDIRRFTRKSLRAGFGMVLQETWLKSGTILENITYGKPDAPREDAIAAAVAAHADAFIRCLPEGYDTVIGEDGGNLSQGQKQLLCIARVMLCLPPMLILDEATSSIDTRTEMLIQHAFDSMMCGRTSFIVAHRLSTIRRADRIIVMKDGKIIETGRHDELIAKNGFYADLYNSQFKGISI